MNDIIKVNLKPEAPVKVNAEAIVIVNPDKIELQDKSVKITENGTQTITPDEGVGGLTAVEVTVDIQPKLQNKEATENGTVAPDEGFDGLGEVVVNVNPALQEKTIKTNGEYTADEGFKGLSKVVVEVEPKLQNKTVEITENGTRTITQDNGSDGLGTVEVKVNVNAEGNGIAALFNKELVSLSDANVLTIPNYAFERHTKLKSVNLPNATSIGMYAFNYTTGLTGEVEFPNVATINSGAFRNSYITSIKLHNAIYIANLVFAGTSSTPQKIKVIDIGAANPKKPSGKTTGIGANCFEYCTALEKLIIRTTGWVYALNSTTAFAKSSIENGTGYIYVPDALVESYKAATNWATYADQIKPLSELPTE